LLLVLIACGAFAPRAVAEPGLDELLAGIRRAEAKRRAALREMVYTANARVVEWTDPSRTEIKQETISERRVYTREPDLMRNEYLSMAIDGRPLSEAEMRRELAKQRRGGGRGQGGGGQFVSPFSPEAAADYTFRFLGESDYEGQPAWRVAFSPVEPGEMRMEGSALVSQSDYQTLFVEMAPSELPSVLKEFAMRIRFAPVQGYWLPAHFRMEMRVKVSVIVTLADRTLTIEDLYSDYRLNPGLDDSVFAVEDGP
jgi:hypothetical protein